MGFGRRSARSAEEELNSKLRPSPPPPHGVYHALCTEASPCQEWFSVQDPLNQRIIDIPASFAPGSACILCCKVVLTLLATACLALGVWIAEEKAFFFAYLTNLSLILSVLYLWTSLYLTYTAYRVTQPSIAARGTVALSWILFEGGVHAQVVASILWWTFVVGSMRELTMAVWEWHTVYGLASHGGVALLCLVDGLMLNRIPVRLTHWWGVSLPVDLLYLLWTLVHHYADIGNPTSGDDSVNDAIYTVLNWNDPVPTGLLAAGILFVIGPLVYLLLWTLSAYHFWCCCQGVRRRYVSKEDASSGDYVAHV